MARRILFALLFHHATAYENETDDVSAEGALTDRVKFEHEDENEMDDENINVSDADSGEIGDAPPLMEDQLRGLHKLLDADGDGKVHVDEILAHNLNISTASLLGEITAPDFIDTIDLNKDGKVSLEEFAGDDEAFLEMARIADVDGDGFLNTTLEWTSVLQPPSNPAVLAVELKHAFYEIDKDHDGSVTSVEYDEEKEDDAPLTFDAIDANQDGAITLDEYQHVMLKYFDESESVAFNELVAHLDKDGDSHISADELALAENLNETKAYQHLASFVGHHEL